jgi:hypothetical protein
MLVLMLCISFCSYTEFLLAMSEMPRATKFAPQSASQLENNERADGIYYKKRNAQVLILM